MDPTHVDYADSLTVTLKRSELAHQPYFKSYGVWVKGVYIGWVCKWIDDKGWKAYATAALTGRSLHDGGLQIAEPQRLRRWAVTELKHYYHDNKWRIGM